MDRKQNLIRKIRNFKKEMSKEIPIDKIIFFGSRVKGSYHRDSDIDLIVISDKFRRIRFIKRPIPLYRSWDLDYPVDFLCYTPEEFKKLSKQITIVREAVREGIKI